MTDWFLLAWIWPLLLAASGLPRLVSGPGQRWERSRPPVEMSAWRASLVVIGVLPAFAAAWLVPSGSTLSLPWLFLGTELGLDETSRVFLLFSTLLWLAAGIDVAQSIRRTEHARRFQALYLLALAGNLWLILGQDLFSFYAGFALMGLACYGLIIHDGRAAALKAGRVYLVMTLLGEVCLFAALVLIAQQTGSVTPTTAELATLDALAVSLTLLGLGVKAGLVPLHLWLPGAYAEAPTPVSAVLGSAMIKVALLGWLRFLPLGTATLPELGAAIAVLGLIAVFYALPIGLVQSDAKALLGYSSISKMGLAVLLIGLILMQPALAPAGIAALTLFAAYHALVKGGLFLGFGLRQHAERRGWVALGVLGGLAFLALALASAPFTSGALSKYLMKPVLNASPWPWLPAAMAVAAVATTLLMARFLWIAVGQPPRQSGHPWRWSALAWSGLVVLVLLFPFVLGPASSWTTNALPVALGLVVAAAVAAAAWAHPAWLRPLIGLVPAGDLLVLARPALDLAARLGRRLLAPVLTLSRRLGVQLQGHFNRVFEAPETAAERRLRHWPVAGALWIGIIAVLLLAMLAGLDHLGQISTKGVG
ncbi:MAG: complex I subunit 5 family protein [Halochromatium sp.]